MIKMIENHAVASLLSVIVIIVVGYIDMRSVFVSTNTQVKYISTTLDRALTLAELTRTEQLLRTDEIEWVQEQRKRSVGER